jgi:hypothetical protein
VLKIFPGVLLQYAFAIILNFIFVFFEPKLKLALVWYVLIVHNVAKL